MQLHPNLQAYVDTMLASKQDEEALAHAQNFAWDERPPQAGADLYQNYFNQNPIESVDAWKKQHNTYVAEHIQLDQDENLAPWTFRAENATNRLTQISPQINLIRVERAEWPCSLMGCSTEDLRHYLDKYQNGDGADKQEGESWLNQFVGYWNEERDKRPLFATTEMEVEDILANPSDAWAEQLRDHLGLGHLNREPDGPPVEIIVLRYTVAETLAVSQTNNACPTVPTVLDSAMSQYFFPSPLPGDAEDAEANPYYGHTLNLSPIASQNDYEMGVELLHPYLPYKPDHLHRFGVIAKPVQQTLARARSFHLPWLQLNKGREDFGA